MRSSLYWRKWLPSDPTPPTWYNRERFERLAAACIADDMQNGRGRTLREFVSTFSGNMTLYVAAAIIVTALAIRRSAARLVLFSAVYSLLYDIFGVVLRRHRPTDVPHTVPHLGAYSFPSGHAAFFVWVAFVIIIVLPRPLGRIWMYGIWAVLAAFVSLACLSRVHVGAHWPSDVVGGLLLGVGWMALTLSIGRLTRPAFGDMTPRQILAGQGPSRRSVG